MAVLDTSFVVDILRNQNAAAELLSELELREDLFVSSPTVMEIWEGALRGKLTQKNRKDVDGFLSAVSVLDFDSCAAKRAAELKLTLSQTPLETEDMLIASVALAHGETLVTRDQDYARVPGLKLLKY